MTWVDKKFNLRLFLIHLRTIHTNNFEYNQRRYHKCVSMIVKYHISAYFNLQFDRKMTM